MVFRRVRLDESLKLTKEDCERIDNWWQNGIDEDGHYDETKDHIFLKRLKKEYPKTYAELIKAVEVEYEENS